MTQGPDHVIGAEGAQKVTEPQTPVADELREFAAEVARLERQASADADVQPFYRVEHQNINIEYPTDD